MHPLWHYRDTVRPANGQEASHRLEDGAARARGGVIVFL